MTNLPRTIESGFSVEEPMAKPLFISAADENVQLMIRALTRSSVATAEGSITRHFSVSDHGEPVQLIDGNPLALVHNVPADAADLVYMWVNNPNNAAEAQLRIQWGAAGAAGRLIIRVPTRTVLPLIPGIALGGDSDIEALVTGENVTLFGHVFRRDDTSL